MQKTLNDFETKKTKKQNNLKYLIIGIFIILFSLFTIKGVFAEPAINNLDIVFDKETYSLMEGTSTKIGFTIENNNPVVAKVLVWADCQDEDDELECNYSKQLTLNANSTYSSSFYLEALDSSDSTLIINLKLLNSAEQDTEEYSVDIEITADQEDGDFSIDIYDSLVCIGQTTQISLEIENDYKDGLYSLYLENPRLAISSEYSNPIQINDNKTIDYQIVVPNNALENENFNLTLKIENEEIKVIKGLTIKAITCEEPNLDFTVSGPTSTTYTLNKGQTKVVTYTLKNISNKNRTFYISEEHSNSELLVEISDRQFALNPEQSKTIDFTFKITENARSGTNDINLNFFDAVNNITKKVKIVINPKYNFKIENLTEANPTLVIGKDLQLKILIDNLGDKSDEFTISVDADNDLRTNISDTKVTVNAYSKEYITIYVYSGENTKPGTSQLSIRVKGKNSGIDRDLFYTIDVIKRIPLLNLELLSSPKSLTLEPNSKREFDITLKNTGEEEITIDSIELINVPQEITLTTEQGITINPGHTKTVSATLEIGDVPKENIDAVLRLVSNNGAVLEKEITLKFDSENLEKENFRSRLLGYLTLRNSILWGVIFICLIIMLFFVLGIFKMKRN